MSQTYDDLFWSLKMLALIIGAATVIYCQATMEQDYEHSEKEGEIYCDMVDIFTETEGQYGWPDYQHKYDRDCK